MAAWLLTLLVAAMIWHAHLPHSSVSASHALLLNDATFTDKVKEKDTLWLVKFCVPWCKHCLKADIVWEELGKALDMEDSVEVGEVDCTSSKATCSEVGIRSYPTIKLFYNGEEYKKYTGKRAVLDLREFVSEAVLELNREGAEKDSESGRI